MDYNEPAPAFGELGGLAVSRSLTLADKLALLFEYGESRGISAAYRTIAVATGENGTNIRKIHHGENLNPGLRTLTALADYFGIGLDYFLCETRTACQDYLSGAAQQRLLSVVPKALTGISEHGVNTLLTWIYIVRRAERLPPVED
jgi:transcriptional regulator with XRE-family HTH domain